MGHGAKPGCITQSLTHHEPRLLSLQVRYALSSDATLQPTIRNGRKQPER